MNPETNSVKAWIKRVFVYNKEAEKSAEQPWPLSMGWIREHAWVNVVALLVTGSGSLYCAVRSLDTDLRNLTAGKAFFQSIHDVVNGSIRPSDLDPVVIGPVPSHATLSQPLAYYQVSTVAFLLLFSFFAFSKPLKEPTFVRAARAFGQLIAFSSSFLLAVYWREMYLPAISFVGFVAAVIAAEHLNTLNESATIQKQLSNITTDLGANVQNVRNQVLSIANRTGIEDWVPQMYSYYKENHKRVTCIIKFWDIDVEFWEELLRLHPEARPGRQFTSEETDKLFSAYYQIRKPIRSMPGIDSKSSPSRAIKDTLFQSLVGLEWNDEAKSWKTNTTLKKVTKDELENYLEKDPSFTIKTNSWYNSQTRFTFIGAENWNLRHKERSVVLETSDPSCSEYAFQFRTLLGIAWRLLIMNEVDEVRVNLGDQLPAFKQTANKAERPRATSHVRIARSAPWVHVAGTRVFQLVEAGMSGNDYVRDLSLDIREDNVSKELMATTAKFYGDNMTEIAYVGTYGHLYIVEALLLSAIYGKESPDAKLTENDGSPSGNMITLLKRLGMLEWIAVRKDISGGNALQVDENTRAGLHARWLNAITDNYSLNAEHQYEAAAAAIFAKLLQVSKANHLIPNHRATVSAQKTILEETQAAQSESDVSGLQNLATPTEDLDSNVPESSHEKPVEIGEAESGGVTVNDLLKILAR